jgi:hypothetical protein
MLGWLGISNGAYWDYTLSGIMYGSGSERDSVFSVINVPGLIGRCVFWGFVPWASFRVRISSSFGSSTDTAFLYLRTDNIYSTGRLMIMKYNPAVGDNWEAWDTCFFPINIKIPVGDIDGDGSFDTIWTRPSRARVENISGGVYEVSISPLRYGIKLTSLSSFFDSIIVWEYYRFKFVPYFGKVEEHLDSQRWKYYRMGTPFEVPFRDLYHKVITTAISEEIRDVELGEKEVYTADGRYVGKSVPNRRGIYFVISGNKRRKVIVK